MVIFKFWFTEWRYSCVVVCELIWKETNIKSIRMFLEKLANSIVFEWKYIGEFFVQNGSLLVASISHMTIARKSRGPWLLWISSTCWPGLILIVFKCVRSVVVDVELVISAFCFVASWFHKIVKYRVDFSREEEKEDLLTFWDCWTTFDLKLVHYGP